jgi:hypothetical protein
MSNGVVLRICQVINTYDDTDGERIKVRLRPEDDKVVDEEIPFVYPLLPKMVHIKPKIGELVLVILTEVGNGFSNRYYVGPIISQPQYMDDESHIYRALSLYPGSMKTPDVAPSLNPNSHGAFAKDEDIAIYGREKSDIILTDNDVRVRCGSRLKDFNEKGGVSFNRTDPAFLHLKHTDNKRGETGDEYRSTATLVADKINLIGNQSKIPFRTNDKDDLINDEEITKILSKAYQLPYGNLLVDFLKAFTKYFINHVHPYPGMPQYSEGEGIKYLTDFDFESLLSNSVRIN